ncbi:MAG: hypothetical protein K0R61_4320 [Microvirga sp.]|jgi:hypothetical protein|nr:hypothetical protein [Geminicoccaceae bacterium]MDF2973870.1 hypothetical protein [Microvirga sp.]
MARIHLSLPDGLKDQLDAQTGVNWSAVAQHAFERELANRRWMAARAGVRPKNSGRSKLGSVTPADRSSRAS